MTTSTHGDRRTSVGPGTALATVLAFFEADGCRDPSAAWQAFTGSWNWAAPLPAAVPAAVPAARVGQGPVVRPVDGGFRLSGSWRLPAYGARGPWLVLPLAPATAAGPDLFVVSSKLLPGTAHPGAVRDRTGQDGPGEPFRLDDAYVPAGFATHAAGTPLRPGDAAFHWTASAALALGAARRLTDLRGGAAAGTVGEAASRAAAAATGLAAVLHDERTSLAAALHGAPTARQGVPSPFGERLASQLRRTAATVHQVVMSVYDHALAARAGDGAHPLVRLIEASAPILLQARYSMELLPPDDRTSPQEGLTR
ncbi:hypothetical protein V2S66_14225 [Streptomyces sp. V4-01]|uniref:Acyl-CoA dehydrogenase n=1 Tax=Actinacidiphila polyblastidii TaxID=3110430 RepID=A0ABU7PBD3_9ACTN|nr:hypothetical protein [Streptomyces sp. V4-01]